MYVLWFARRALRRCVRQMCVCAVFAVCALLMVTHNASGRPLDTGEIVAVLLTGVLFAAPVWFFWRILMFTVDSFRR